MCDSPKNVKIYLKIDYFFNTQATLEDLINSRAFSFATSCVILDRLANVVWETSNKELNLTCLERCFYYVG